jgi:hypothetical protein
MNGVNPREQVVSLKNLNGGAAIELFDAELAKGVADIADINTSGKVARQLNVKDYLSALAPLKGFTILA